MYILDNCIIIIKTAYFNLRKSKIEVKTPSEEANGTVSRKYLRFDLNYN